MLVDRAEGKDALSSHRARFDQLMIQFGEIVAKSMAFADMLGRLRLIKNAKAQEPEMASTFSRYKTIVDDLPDFLKLPFDEAIDAFAQRDPILVEDAAAIADAYLEQSFAITRSTRIEFTQKVQQSLISAQQAGESMTSFIKKFRDEGLSDGYAETVWRTNLKTASTAGRFRLANSEELTGFIVAFRYFSVRIDATRSNHEAMHGMMYAVDSTVWGAWAPPNGFN